MNQITDIQIAGLIAWRLSPLINVVTYLEVLKRVGSPGAFLDANPEEPELAVLVDKLRLKAYRQEARETLLRWQEGGIGVVVLGAPDYPEALLTIPDPPLLLTYRGNWSPDLLESPRVSIVGSRRADTEGIEIARYFASELRAGGACIVSGLALGVDGAAHRGAIDRDSSSASDIPTIAVCGNGLGQVYPRSHLQLAREIIERGGTLLSQFDPREPPYPVNFLNRNRLIAALSIATLVIQASEKSGSLVTARNALEFGRELLIVPGSIKDPRYAGSNKLLQHGAHLVTRPSDIYELIPELRARLMHHAAEKRVPEDLQWLYRLLEKEKSIAMETLYQQSPQPERFYEQVLILELDGIIKRMPGNQLCLATAMRLT